MSYISVKCYLKERHGAQEDILCALFGRDPDSSGAWMDGTGDVEWEVNSRAEGEEFVKQVKELTDLSDEEVFVNEFDDDDDLPEVVFDDDDELEVEDVDPENIYGLPGIRQSIEKERK